MHIFVIGALRVSDLVYYYCSQKNQHEGNCFKLKDVKFSENFYPSKFNFNAEIQHFMSVFTPST